MAFSDLNMFEAPGGRERTLEQYRLLLSAADLTLTAAIPTGTPTFILEHAHDSRDRAVQS